MPLTKEQREELDALGAATVRMKLIQPGAGRGAAMSGFQTGTLTRGDVEDWLIEMAREEARQQNRTLHWSIIGGCAAIAAVVVGVITIAVTIWLAK